MMQVLLLGDADRREMQPVVTWLTAGTEPLHCASFIEDVSDNWQPDLIVVLESHPDEFTTADIERLIATSPLARIVCCAGGWSESAGRTRKRWPLAFQVPVTAALARLEQEWKLLTHAGLSLYLPPTGSREEWFAVHHGVKSAPTGPEQELSRGAARTTAHPLTLTLSPAAGERGPEKDSRLFRVRVISADPHFRQMLIDSLALHGSVDEAADIILWDVDPWSDAMRDAIQYAAQTSSIIALANWITPDWEAGLLSSGVQAVVPKLGNLRHNVAHLLRKR